MKIRLREVVIAILLFVAVFAAIFQFRTGSFKAEGGIAILWWFAGAVLMSLSFVVWLAGLKGKEAVLSVGKRTVAESKERKTRTEARPANVFSIVVGILGILIGLTIILFLVAL
jgi:hypothetical protein